MQIKRLIIIAGLSFLTQTSCKKDDLFEKWFSGTLEISPNGCNYITLDDTNYSYNVVDGLPDEFKQDGLKVKVKYKVLYDRAIYAICYLGKDIIELTSIKQID